MAYATPQQLIDRLGEREALALSDRARAGTVDQAVLTLALADASDEVNAYVGRRYTLPLATPDGTPLSAVPTMLTRLVIDVARYRLSGTEVMETDPVRNRFKDAVRVLEQIADGRIDLGDLLLAKPGGPASIGGNNAVRTGNKTFDMTGVL